MKLIDRTARQQLLEELTRERWAPLLPPPVRLPPRARQTTESNRRHPGARPTGTGWPA